MVPLLSPLSVHSVSLISEDVCKRGFTVIIDMRGSKWELIKPLLKTLQEFFPAEICVALIIKPDNFWQKQKTNFGSAKFSFEVSGLPCFSPTYSTLVSFQIAQHSSSTLIVTVKGLFAEAGSEHKRNHSTFNVNSCRSITSHACLVKFTTS